MRWKYATPGIEEKSFGRKRKKWCLNTHWIIILKTDLKNVRREWLDCLHLTKIRKKWLTLVNMLMAFAFNKNKGNFSTSWAASRFFQGSHFHVLEDNIFNCLNLQFNLHYSSLHRKATSWFTWSEASVNSRIWEKL